MSSMSLDEMCAALRTANIVVYIHSVPPEHRRRPTDLAAAFAGDPDALAAAQTPEFLEGLHIHQGALAFMLLWSTVQVCMDTEQHRQCYRYVSQAGMQFFVCDECAAIRQAALDRYNATSSDPALYSVIADFRPPLPPS